MTKQVKESKHLFHSIDTSFESKPSALLATNTLTDESKSEMVDAFTPDKAKETVPVLPAKPVLNVGVIQISPVHVLDAMQGLNESSDNINTGFLNQNRTFDGEQNTTYVSQQVENALSGERSGTVHVVSNTWYSGTVDQLFHFLMDQVAPGEPNQNRCNIDILVVIGTSVRREQTSGYFRSPYIRYMQVAHMLRQRLEKTAISMSLFAKQNAAKQDSIVGALFEMVIGYLYTINLDEQGDDERAMKFNGIDSAPKNGCVVVFVAEECIDMSLSSIRGLIKHALHVARMGVSLEATKAIAHQID